MATFVGIDVSKGKLDWAVHHGAEGSTGNHKRGIRRLVAQLQPLRPTLVAVESTGGYERALLEELQQAGVPVALVNPWRVRRFAEGLGELAKTDPIDARLLARFADQARPAPTAPKSPEQRETGHLARRRRQLITMIVAEKNRLEHADACVRRDLQTLIQILERRVAKLDDRLDPAIHADVEKRELAERLQSAPCVGPGIARTLIAELPELGALDRRQIAALVGVAPYARDSGRKQGARWIRAGRAAPRTALYLAALNGARFNPVLRRFYTRLIEAGKPPKLALIALARKLLTILNAMARDRSDWQQDIA